MIAGVGALPVIVSPAAADVETPRCAVLLAAVGVGGQAPSTRTKGEPIKLPEPAPGARGRDVGLNRLPGGVYSLTGHATSYHGYGYPFAAGLLADLDPLLVGRTPVRESVRLPDAVQSVGVEA